MVGPGRRRVTLTGRGPSLDEVAAVARGEARVGLAKRSRAAVAASAEALARHAETGRPLYGLTTGVGALDGEPVAGPENRAHQLALIRSHAAGVGAPMRPDQVRAMVLARTANLACGRSGVRPEVVDALVDLLNAWVVPRVPGRGSVGAADLAPLAHVALVLCGEGWASVGDELLPGGEALARAGLRPLRLEGREGLALMNGLGQTVGTGVLAVRDAAGVVAAAELGAAATRRALGRGGSSTDPRTVAAKPHPGSQVSAARLRALQGAALPAGGDVRTEREPLSTRCAHHVQGAAREAVAFATSVLETELRGAVDNPMIDPDGWATSNAANFEGQHLTQALDLVQSALLAVAATSERRTALLLDPARNQGLPAFLVHPDARPGVSSGLMMAQVTAASLVAELRMGAAPASGQTISTCAGLEDTVSMCAPAARRLAGVVETVEVVVAIELLTAAQALDLRGPPLPAALEAFRAALRARVPVQVEDRVLADDIEAVRLLLRSGALDPPRGAAAVQLRRRAAGARPPPAAWPPASGRQPD